jgi:hypothetical protein
MSVSCSCRLSLADSPLQLGKYNVVDPLGSSSELFEEGGLLDGQQQILSAQHLLENLHDMEHLFSLKSTSTNFRFEQTGCDEFRVHIIVHEHEDDRVHTTDCNINKASYQQSGML